MLPSLFSRSALTLTLALSIAACDPVFGPRPIGGGSWDGTHVRVAAPAELVWPAVSEALEAGGAGKQVPHPVDARTAVRVTWEGRWVKVAVDPASNGQCLLSVYAMNGLDRAHELLGLLSDGLTAEGLTVDHVHARSAEEVAAQRERVDRPYTHGYWGGAHASDTGHGDQHGSGGGH